MNFTSDRILSKYFVCDGMDSDCVGIVKLEMMRIRLFSKDGEFIYFVYLGYFSWIEFK